MLNNKGFTLIELLMTIVLLAIVITIAFPFIGEALSGGKQKSYDIMVSNILTAASSYYEECLYNGSSIDCTINNNTVHITLQELVDLGFLSASDTVCENSECETKNVIKNPKDREDIGNCMIEIKRSVSDKGRVSYEVISKDNVSLSCPKELGSVS